MLVGEENEIAKPSEDLNGSQVQFGLYLKDTQVVIPMPLGLTEKQAMESLKNSNSMRKGRGFRPYVLGMRVVTQWEEV